MNTKNLVGGTVIVAFLAGGYFSGLFPKFGSGTGFGTGTGAEKQESGSAKSPPVVTATPEEPPADAPQVAADLASDPRVLEVRVAGRTYEVVEHGEKSEIFREIALPALVELAKKKEGDDRGVRVKIRLLSTSRASAEESLKQALHDAGLRDDAITWEQITP